MSIKNYFYPYQGHAPTSEGDGEEEEEVEENLGSQPAPGIILFAIQN